MINITEFAAVLLVFMLGISSVAFAAGGSSSGGKWWILIRWLVIHGKCCNWLRLNSVNWGKLRLGFSTGSRQAQGGRRSASANRRRAKPLKGSAGNAISQPD